MYLCFAICVTIYEFPRFGTVIRSVPYVLIFAKPVSKKFTHEKVPVYINRKNVLSKDRYKCNRERYLGLSALTVNHHLLSLSKEAALGPLRQ